MTAPHPRDAVERAARQSYGRLLAFLAARTGNVAAAEDALADAFASALATWPAQGIPRAPEAWLFAVARRKAIDAARRRQTIDAASLTLRLLTDEEAPEDDPMPDHRLALMFACAHPAIDPALRAPLILQTILGFDAAAIASAFLVSPAAMSQRLVRAKRKIADAGIPFRIPDRADLAERLDAVLDAIYAAFAEGWSDPAGTDASRRDLGEEAIWLGRLIVTLLPEEPEAAGLLALMLHAEARRPARRAADGGYVRLADQDPTLWEEDLIAEAESQLHRVSAQGRIGRFQLEAAIQSAHAARRRTGRTDWAAIVTLYDALLQHTHSPVVAINRAVALAECCRPIEGLAALDAIAGDARLRDYQPYWAARAALLARTGNRSAAGQALDRAIGLTRDPAVRSFLQRISDQGAPRPRPADALSKRD